MGEANRRGTFEIRKEKAIKRDKEKVEQYKRKFLQHKRVRMAAALKKY